MSRADQLKDEIKRRYVEPGDMLPAPEAEEPIQEPAVEEELPCDLCSITWPADALENGVCPDCLDSDEEPA
jgi:hypothetical protein